jgi:hypothetical protein
MYSQYSFYYIHECIRTFINFSVFCTKFQPVVIPSFKDDRVVVTTLESTWNSTLLKPRARTTFKHSTKLHYICIARSQSLCKTANSLPSSPHNIPPHSAIKMLSKLGLRNLHIQNLFFTTLLEQPSVLVYYYLPNTLVSLSILEP